LRLRRPLHLKVTQAATGGASSRPQPTSITSIAGDSAQRRGYTPILHQCPAAVLRFASGSLSRGSHERCLEVSAEGRASIRRCRARSRIRYNAGDIGEDAIGDSKSASWCG